MSSTLYSPVFYEPSFAESQSLIQLSPEESRHAIQVLRVGIGDECLVVNGRGLGKIGRVTSIDSKLVTIATSNERSNVGEPDVHVTLGLGVSTNDRFDAAIAAGIEAGASRFVPLVCDKCKFNASDEKSAKRRERWERIAIAAMKQSRRSRLAAFDEPVGIDTWLAEASSHRGHVFAFSPEGEDSLEFSSHSKSDVREVSILIGPVAGFSEREISLLQKMSGSGVTIVTLGERILRFETAAPVATALVLAAFGEYTRAKKCR